MLVDIAVATLPSGISPSAALLVFDEEARVEGINRDATGAPYDVEICGCCCGTLGNTVATEWRRNADAGSC